MENKIRLYGFNNLTKVLSFNIYDICYAKTAREQKDYVAYIDEQYNSERLTNILVNLTDMIGAKILNIAKQDYEPQGASVTILISEESKLPSGEITPLSTLNYLIQSFDSDIITMDYRIRGFTRDVDGKKLFMDHKIASIQEYIMPEILRRYDAIDINVYEANLFHTKMMVKELDLEDYLFKTDVYELPPTKRLEIINSLRREMIEIFSGRNIF